MTKSFGKLIVSNPNETGKMPLTLTFTNRFVMEETAHELKKLGYEITDEFFGYELCTSAAQALEVAKIFLR